VITGKIMSNTRKLRPSLTGSKPTVYSCAVCRLKFFSWADREAHWKYDKGARMCRDLAYMTQVLGFKFSRDTWRVTGNRPQR
jgi:hypothetical protein